MPRNRLKQKGIAETRQLNRKKPLKNGNKWIKKENKKERKIKRRPVNRIAKNKGKKNPTKQSK